MKTKIKNIKYLIIGIIIGLSLISAATYAYTTQAGKIGSLFEKIGSNYKLKGDEIKDNTVDNSEIENDTAYQVGRLGIRVYPSNNVDLAVGDNDTGLKQQGDGELAIYTNNNERVRVDNNGKVGIGITSPTQKLDVNGAIKWGDSILSTDQGGSIELGSTGTPYIDFKNDTSSDYDGRIILTGNDELRIDGANLKVSKIKTTCIGNCY